MSSPSRSLKSQIQVSIQIQSPKLFYSYQTPVSSPNVYLYQVRIKCILSAYHVHIKSLSPNSVPQINTERSLTLLDSNFLYFLISMNIQTFHIFLSQLNSCQVSCFSSQYSLLNSVFISTASHHHERLHHCWCLPAPILVL